LSNAYPIRALAHADALNASDSEFPKVTVGASRPVAKDMESYGAETRFSFAELN
jgi:hypothetical protein